MPVDALEEVPFLKQRRLQFDSMAEMIFTRAQETPDQAHVIFYDEVITYSQTNERANKVANFLKEKGVTRGDVVSEMIMNSPNIYYALFGIQKLGAIGHAINYLLKGPEIAYVLDDCRPKVVFVGSEFMKDFARGYEMAQHKPIIIEVVTDVKHDENIAQGTLAEILEKYPSDEALVPQLPDDPFILLYSSGTTGLPKGILVPNRAEMSCCRALATSGVFAGDDVMMIILPMFHTNPLCVWTYPVTYAGQTICIRSGFSPTDFWPAIIENEVTLLMGVPAMYDYVYNTIDPATVDTSRLKLRYAISGAAPLRVDLIRDFKEQYNVDIIEGYGLTEVVGVSTLNPLRGKKKPGSVGVALPEQQVEILDDKNNPIPQGQRGEVCMKGDAVMIGYMNKPEATAETIIDGWLHSGDIGYIDEEGYLYIVDRKKDMINRGGENIYPREVELAIEAHPKVGEVAVIGVPDQALGERVKAFVVPKEGLALTGEELREFLADRIAKYKIPEFIDITSDIPRNPTGKILKTELRKLAQERA